jgi:hypothetical protein
MPSTTCAQAFKEGLEAAARAAVAAAAPALQVTYDWGEPDTWSDDCVLFMGLESTLVPGAMGSQRSRTEEISCEVHVITRRTTQREADLAAYMLVGWIERHIRMVDPTLGGVALDFGTWLTGHEADGFTPPDDYAGGRGCEVIATFTARVRISN